MATPEECFAAIMSVVERFNSIDAGRKRERIPPRSVGCTLLDLDITDEALRAELEIVAGISNLEAGNLERAASLAAQGRSIELRGRGATVQALGEFLRARIATH